MDGRTSAQVVADVLAALQGAAAITGTVPSSRIVHSRIAPLPESALPSILVFSHRESENWSGLTAAAPILSVATEVAVQLYVTAATDAGLEAAMDLADAIKATILTDSALETNYERTETVDTQRFLNGDSTRRLGMVQLLWRVRHTRMW